MIRVPKELKRYVISHEELMKKTKHSGFSLSDTIIEQRNYGRKGKSLAKKIYEICTGTVVDFDISKIIK